MILSTEVRKYESTFVPSKVLLGLLYTILFPYSIFVHVLPEVLLPYCTVHVALQYTYMYVYNVALRVHVHYLISSVMINSLLPSKATYFITFKGKLYNLLSKYNYNVGPTVYFLFISGTTRIDTRTVRVLFMIYEWLLDKYCSVLSYFRKYNYVVLS